MKDNRFATRKSKLIYALAFLVGFPSCGALFGYVFFLVLSWMTGPYGEVALRLSVILWAIVGIVAGVYAFWAFSRYDKALDQEGYRRD